VTLTKGTTVEMGDQGGGGASCGKGGLPKTMRKRGKAGPLDWGKVGKSIGRGERGGGGRAKEGINGEQKRGEVQ